MSPTPIMAPADKLSPSITLKGGGEVAIRTSRTTKATPRETSLMKKEFKPKYSFFLIVLKLPMELNS